MIQLRFNTGSCYSEGLAKLYGDPVEFYRLQDLTGNLGQEMRSVAEADSARQNSLSSWLTCMTAQGWAGVSSPDDAFSQAIEKHWAGKPDALTFEKNIAYADVLCRQESDFENADKAANASAIKVLRARHEGEINAFRELKNKALIQAGGILSDS